MAVKIRLRRMGAQKQPHYRVVVADSRQPRDGKFIEVIGHYHPLRDPAEVVLKDERALYWLERGALPTETARSLLRKAGIWARFAADKQARKPKRLPAEQQPEEQS